MARGGAQHRAAGDCDVGFPRVAAAFEYHRPLRFEDEFDVRIRIAGIEREDDSLRVRADAQDGDQHRHRDDDRRLRRARTGDAA